MVYHRPNFNSKIFTKFRKSRIRGVTQPVCLKYDSVVGLQVCENTKITSATLWSLQRVIQQSVNRKAKIHLLSFPHLGLTKKPSEVRIGKGRGNVSTFITRARSGDLLFQISNVPVDLGVKALKKAQFKLGVSSRIIVRTQPSFAVSDSFFCSLFF